MLTEHYPQYHQTISQFYQTHIFENKYKDQDSELDVPPVEVDLLPSGRAGRACQGGGDQRLRELGGRDSASPLWRSTTARGVKDWNSLPASTLSAETASIFSGRLAKAGP